MQELNKILNADEKVLWEGGPQFWPFCISTAIPAFIFGVIWMTFLFPFIGLNFFSEQWTGQPADYSSPFFIVWNIFLIPFVAIGLWMIFGMGFYSYLLYRRLHYAITNRRVIVQKGVIGRDFEYIDFDQITNAEVRVGFWDKVFQKDTGSILIASAGSFTFSPRGQGVSRPYTLSHIVHPYDVFKFFKKVSHDVKTDIQYPNKLRPTENPGYQTEYKPEKE